MSLTKLTHKEWITEMVKRFGHDPMNWKVVCPVCKTVQSVGDFDALVKNGINIEPDGVFAFSCIGRFLIDRIYPESDTTKGCDYTNGGLIRLGPLEIDMGNNKTRLAFDFAPAVIDEPTTIVPAKGEKDA